jgi:hypothetical protein
MDGDYLKNVIHEMYRHIHEFYTDFLSTANLVHDENGDVGRFPHFEWVEELDLLTWFNDARQS